MRIAVVLAGVLSSSLVACGSLESARVASQVFELPAPTGYEIRPDGRTRSDVYLVAVEAPAPCGKFRATVFSCVPMEVSATYPTVRSLGLRRLAVVAPYPAPLAAMNDRLQVLYEARTDAGPPKEFRVTPIANLPSADFSFVPVGMVIDGEAVYRDWIRLADRGEPFQCNGKVCSQLVLAKALLDGHHVSGVASCGVLFHEGARLGFPLSCGFVAFELDGTLYLLAATEFMNQFYAKMGQTDFYVEIVRDPPVDDAGFVRVLTKVLQGPPFELRQVEEDRSVFGVAEHRYSKLLGMWATETVRITMNDTSRSPDAQGRRLAVATALNVSAQNSASPSDWHEPTKQQEQHYILKLRERLQEALTVLCARTPSWRLEPLTMRLECDGAEP